MENQEDPYMWLEEVESENALNWVKIHNQKTVETLFMRPDFEKIYQKILAILNSRERIALPANRGEYFYNFWQDESNPRGIWRRAIQKDYILSKGTPEWEMVLDMAAKMEEQGHSFFYFENTGGGHGVGVTNEQRPFMMNLEYATY